jgi:hypothetical protein
MRTTRSPWLSVAFMLLTSDRILNAFRSSSSFLGLRHSRHTQIQFRSSTSSSALCMKTIAVFGASGLTAAECVYQALQNGDTVIGLTRYVVPMYILGRTTVCICHPDLRSY